jgi:hypothetical protein
MSGIGEQFCGVAILTDVGEIQRQSLAAEVPLNLAEVA